MNESDETILSSITGKVKWFNNKAGYGFITVSDEGAYQNNDIFAHYTAIRVTTSQYKFLVQGEYVQFDLVKSVSGPHEYKAMSVTGIKGGELMCETRSSSRPTRDDEFVSVKQKKPRNDFSNRKQE